MQPLVYHDSQDIYFRNPFGAVVGGQKVLLRIQVCPTLGLKQCYFRLWEGGKEKLLPMKMGTSNPFKELCGKVQCEIYEIEYIVPVTPQLIWYYFILHTEEQIYFYGNNKARIGGVGSVYDYAPPSYQITVYHPMSIPDWFKAGIMYQIFVDRYYNGNERRIIQNSYKKALIHANWYDTPFYIKDEKGRVLRWTFFGGNLKGVIKKLPYLNELGINIIYFNPIFEASSNHKYDTADYKKIDPMYGDVETFELLVSEARKLGISIILDGVFSHTGSDSIYFNKDGNYPSLGASQASDSPYYSWYKWKEDGTPFCWWGIEDLPEVNELNPSYQEFIYGAENSVLQTWMAKGVRGWRLDVADELPDLFIKELRISLKKINPEAILIGEVWEDASNKVSYGMQREYFGGYELDSTMNYPFRETFLQFLLGQCKATDVHQKVMSLYENYPRENFYAAMNLIGSHDRVRILTLLGDAPPAEEISEKEQEDFKLSKEAYELAIKRLKLLTLVQMGFPGVPCIYYGDEAGVEGYTDPYNRGTYPWGSENQEILQWYKKVLRLRQEYEVLQQGEFISFDLGEDVYGFKRVGEDEEVYIFINRHLSETRIVEYPLSTQSLTSLETYQILDLLEGKLLDQDTNQGFEIEFEPLSCKAFLLQKRLKGAEKLARSCGVLMHISSLPSPWGIGDFGEEAYHFVDFLVNSGQSLWQVLPLNPVGVGYSPYQSDSAFSGNPMFIDLNHLIKEGLLSEEYVEKSFLNHKKKFVLRNMSFSQISQFKMEILRKAYIRFVEILQDKSQIKKTKNQISTQDSNMKFLSRENYLKFQEENQEWLKDYTLYLSIKLSNQGSPWYEWEEEIVSRSQSRLQNLERHYQEEMNFHCFVQYVFDFQWQALKQYANRKGIHIVGDMPIFVALDSCDIWINRDLFSLDEKNKPEKVAGVPPDYFSPTGQLWGNPVYDWNALKERNYTWWKLRIKQALKRFDVLRLDHFRGFEAYWEVPAEEKTAIYGRWMKGPGRRFFESLLNDFESLPLIAEDLGIITPEVNILKMMFGFPGMKVLQFTSLEQFEAEGEINTVYYSGTHDNDTLLGWTKALLKHPEGEEDVLKQVRSNIEALYQSQAAWVILPLQDILGLDSEARMNTPGTIEGNWQWRVEKKCLTSEIQKGLRTLAKRYGRTGQRIYEDR